MAISTYQKLFVQNNGTYEERLTSYEEDGYKLKFPEYDIWRLIYSDIFEDLKKMDKDKLLNLSFILNAVPCGEGENEYLESSFVKSQMITLIQIIADYLQNNQLSENDKKTLDYAKADAENMLKLCEFAEGKNMFIMIGLDA